MFVVEASQYKDCSICLTEFELGEEVIRIPCKYVARKSMPDYAD